MTLVKNTPNIQVSTCSDSSFDFDQKSEIFDLKTVKPQIFNFMELQKQDTHFTDHSGNREKTVRSQLDHYGPEMNNYDTISNNTSSAQ